MPASLVSARAASPCDLDPMARAAFENSSMATVALAGSPAGRFDSTGTLSGAGVAILGILKGSCRGSANASVGGGGGGVSTTAPRARVRAFGPGLVFPAVAVFFVPFGRIPQTACCCFLCISSCCCCFLCLSSMTARVSSSSSSSSSSAGAIGVSCSGEESSPRSSSSMFMTSATKASTSLALTSFPRGPCSMSDRRMDSRTLSLSSDSSRGSSTRREGRRRRRRLIAGSVDDGDRSSSSPSINGFSSPGRMVAALSVSFFSEPNFCDSRGHAYPRQSCSLFLSSCSFSRTTAGTGTGTGSGSGSGWVRVTGLGFSEDAPTRPAPKGYGSAVRCFDRLDARRFTSCVRLTPETFMTAWSVGIKWKTPSGVLTPLGTSWSKVVQPAASSAAVASSSLCVSFGWSFQRNGPS